MGWDGDGLPCTGVARGAIRAIVIDIDTDTVINIDIVIGIDINTVIDISVGYY